MHVDRRTGEGLFPKRPSVGQRLRRIISACTDGRLLERMWFLWRARRQVRAILASGLLDPAWYARDGGVGGSPGALVWHYVRRGAAEGRSPSPAFDTVAYLRDYPEAGFSGLNPLYHYIVQGRAAGYVPAPAPPGRLARLELSDESYQGWREEMAVLSAPGLAGWRGRAAALPRLAVAGDGDGEAGHVLLLPPGVGMAEQAVLEIRRAIARSRGAAFFYADEDCVGPDGRHAAPWFKPDWDPELFLAGDLTGPATVMARETLARLGWDGAVPDAAGLRGLAERAVVGGCRPVHIPKILFHRCEKPRLVRVAWKVPEPRPLISVIIPTRDRAGFLRVAAQGVLERTDYGPLELIILDNGSREAATRRLLGGLSADARVRVVAAPGAFNWSALNNAGARLARGEIFLFLNNDIEVIAGDWLGALAARALRPDVGAVGARLLYPNGTIQHAGLSLDGNGVFCHVFRGAAADDPGVGLTRSVAAVTGACLAVRREVFRAVGGFEEEVLAVTCNDIDFCCRVREAGYRVVYAADAVLEHREAATRGHDEGEADIARVRAEREYLRRRWGDLTTRDPYLNANLCLLDHRPALEAPARLME